MAVVTTKSAQITAHEATPPTKLNSRVVGASLRESVGVLESVSGDSATSVYRLLRVKSSDRVSDVLIAADALGGTCAADVGLYQTTENGGAVVDADFFGSAVSLVNAVAWTSVAYESGVRDAANVGKQLWEELGLTSDPQREYDLALTLTADSAAAGTVAAKARVVRD